MLHPNIRSRAGLVAIVFALIISLVSSAPISVTASGLSFTLGRRLDDSEIYLSGRMSTPSLATRPALEVLNIFRATRCIY